MPFQAKNTAACEQQAPKGEKSSGPNWLKNGKTHVYKEKYFLLERDVRKESTPLDSNKVNAPTSPSTPSTKLGSSCNRLCGESKCPDTDTVDYPYCKYRWGLSETHLHKVNCYGVRGQLHLCDKQQMLSLIPGGSPPLTRPFAKRFLAVCSPEEHTM